MQDFYQIHPKRTRDEKERKTDQKNMNGDRELSRDGNRETEHGSDRNRHRKSQREARYCVSSKLGTVSVVNKQLACWNVHHIAVSDLRHKMCYRLKAHVHAEFVEYFLARLATECVYIDKKKST